MHSCTSLLINCYNMKALRIRISDLRQHHTISDYILNILMKAIRYDESLAHLHELGGREKFSIRNIEFYGLGGFSSRPPGPRTTMLLSCPMEDAHRIRETAKRKETTISGLVLHALRLAWAIPDGKPPAPQPRGVIDDFVI